MSIRLVWKRLALLTFGCVLALSLAELGLRIVGYAGDQERGRRVFDPRYGAVPRDSWIWSFRIDPRVHRAVELRGHLIPLDKPEAETRVLFLGDSATEGAFVGALENFPSLFQRLVDERTPGSRVRAINAGVWGMTTIDEYHLLQDKLLPLRPDVVVIGLFMANDLNMNLGHRARRPNTTAPGSFLREHSALAHFVSLRLLALAARRPGLAAGGGENALLPEAFSLVDERGLSMLSYPAGELATYVVPTSALMERGFDTLARVFADFQALGRREGFRVRVLLIPSPSRVMGRLAILHYPNLLRELSADGIQIDPSSIDVDEPTRRVLAICARLDLPCVDPTRRLQRLGPRAFFPSDEHPSALAHHALAEELLGP